MDIHTSAVLLEQAAIYGMNASFGKLAHQHIAQADLDAQQLNLLSSDAAGVNDAMPKRVLRLVLPPKAASFARRFSGIGQVVIDLLLVLHNHRLSPVVSGQGSGGASGNPARLHICTSRWLVKAKFFTGGRVYLPIKPCKKPG